MITGNRRVNFVTSESVWLVNVTWCSEPHGGRRWFRVYVITSVSFYFPFTVKNMDVKVDLRLAVCVWLTGWQCCLHPQWAADRLRWWTDEWLQRERSFFLISLFALCKLHFADFPSVGQIKNILSHLLWGRPSSFLWVTVKHLRPESDKNRWISSFSHTVPNKKNADVVENSWLWCHEQWLHVPLVPSPPATWVGDNRKQRNRRE